MSSPHDANDSGVRSFRTKLLVTMMLVVSTLTIVGVYLGERGIMADAERDLNADFANQLAALHQLENQRHAVLVERCRTLVAKPRLHAALEDNALDLLYPTAKDELRELMAPDDAGANRTLRAEFYRFLDQNGAVIRPPADAGCGTLGPDDEKLVAISKLPGDERVGYLMRTTADGRTAVDELFVVPISSTVTGEPIAALAAGFALSTAPPTGAAADMKSGVWLRGKLHLEGVNAETRAAVAEQLSQRMKNSGAGEGRFSMRADNVPSLVFYKQLHPDPLFPPAHEVCVYSLTNFIARQLRLRWSFLGGGTALLAIGLVISHSASRRLARPVETLAVQSEVDRAGRREAETALANTSVELQRSARFSADASHQLKSPVTVLRAGLESLLGRHDLAPEVYDELSSLLHQTYRLTGTINDLLLLSRMDAGRVQIDFKVVNLTQLVTEWLDDLSALPDAVEVAITTDLPRDLLIAGDRTYASLIVQNLLENARKYNRPSGRIKVSATENDGYVTLTVCNTGRAIPAEAHEHIFERFHRGTVGENVPGHGLGLNLARELARLHGGELWLVESNDDWTEFAVKFRSASAVV